jgi:hypothetical protein
MPRDGTLPSASGSPTRRTLANDSRGFGIQIDFLTASTIYIAAWVLFLTVSISVLSGLAPPATANRIAAERGADTLADDLLVSDPNKVIIDRACTEAFFTQNSPGGCGYNPNWGTGSGSYLEAALHLSEKNINVNIRDTSGSIQSINGAQLQLGDRVPGDGENVEGWERQAALDYDGDGTVEWVVIKVRVWS